MEEETTVNGQGYAAVPLSAGIVPSLSIAVSEFG
jgi:hypothetical protein